MWTLCKVPADWQRHCEETARALNIVGTCIKWGDGPQSYPCLLASLQQGPGRMVTAFVYETEARMLMAALPATQAFVAEQAQMASQSPETLQAQQMLQAEVPGGEPIGSQQQNFNVYVAAHLLTVAWFLVESGLCGKEGQKGFETKLAEFTAQVDQWHTADIEARLRETLRQH